MSITNTIMRIKRFSTNEQIQYRRDRTWKYLLEGASISDISHNLSVSRRTVKRDILFLIQDAQNRHEEFVNELPFHYQQSLETFQIIKQRAVSIADQAGDSRTKIQALKLVQETETSKYRLLQEGPNILLMKELTARMQKLEEEDKEGVQKIDRKHCSQTSGCFRQSKSPKTWQLLPT
jgi:hypothetical protein